MKKNILLITLFCSPLVAYNQLNDIQQRIQHLPESPPIDIDEWQDPEFETLYKSRQPNLVQQIINYLFPQKSSWSQYELNKHLDHLLGVAAPKKSRDNYFISSIDATTDSRFIVFGDLHGSLHSFTRDLLELQKLGILSDDMKIAQDSCYIIFLGNVIGRFAYNIDTLSIVLHILENNPQKAFYIRGQYEDKSYWNSFSTLREIRYIMAGLLSTKETLKDQLDAFFATLPIGVMVRFPNNEGILLTHTPTETVLNLAKNMRERTQIAIVVQGEQPFLFAQYETGLNFSPQESYATVWTVLSAGNTIYKKYTGFYKDAFAIIDTNSSPCTSSIALHSRDIATQKEFVQGTTYNLCSGRESRSDVEQPTNIIKIGSTMALTRGAAGIGREVKQGIMARLASENKKSADARGASYMIKSYILDDEYMPSLARKNIAQLLNNIGVNLILLPIGTPTLDAYYNDPELGKAIVLFPTTGAGKFRKPEIKNIINYRPSYAEEVRVILDYIMTNHRSKRFFIFYQDDGYGLDPLVTATKIFSEKKITEFAATPYTRNTTKFDTQVKKLLEFQPDVIGLFATASAGKEFLRQVGSENLFGKIIFGVSFMIEENFKKYIDKKGLTYVVAHAVPNPRTSNLPIAQEFRAAMDLEKLPYDSFALEGFIGASIFLDTLNHLNSPYSPQKTLDIIESYSHYQFKGLDLTFNATQRSLNQPVWIDLNDQEDWIPFAAQTSEQQD